MWRSEVEKRFQRYGRPVDLIINLDGLVVRPSAARAFGAARSEVLAEYTRCSFRYNGNAQTRTSIYTSAVLLGADANLHDSREEALKALLAFRQSGEWPSRSPLAPASQRAPVSAPPSTLRGAGVPPSSQRSSSLSGVSSPRLPPPPHTPSEVTQQRQYGPLSQRAPLGPASSPPSTPRVPSPSEPPSQRPPPTSSGTRAESRPSVQPPSSETTAPMPGVTKKQTPA